MLEELKEKYKNSTKNFTANGPGSYPKELKVPNNIDLSTARMTDEGELIDPNDYKLI